MRRLRSGIISVFLFLPEPLDVNVLIVDVVLARVVAVLVVVVVAVVVATKKRK